MAEFKVKILKNASKCAILIAKTKRQKQRMFRNIQQSSVFKKPLLRKRSPKLYWNWIQLQGDYALTPLSFSFFHVDDIIYCNYLRTSIIGNKKRQLCFTFFKLEAKRMGVYLIYIYRTFRVNRITYVP